MKSASGTNILDFPAGHRATLLAALLLVGAMLSLSYVYGSRRQAEALESRAQVVAQEHEAFCRRFDTAFAAVPHAECLSALNDLRKRHEQPPRTEAEGLL